VSPPPLSPNGWLRWELVRRLLDGVTGVGSVLEIGAGQGGMGWRLAQRYDYRGYEPDADSFQVAERRIGKVWPGEVLNTSLPAVPDRLFDLAIACEVLEHMEHDEIALQEWARWVRPHGHLLMSVPANPNRFGPCDSAVGHYRRYDRPRCERLFQGAGFEVLSLWSYGFPLGYLLEFARNRLASRVGEGQMVARTAASGRFRQPRDRQRALTNVGTFPFRLLQLPFVNTSLGTGLVALGQRRP
jgi:SAM-dependent methyltransferase